MGQVRTQMEAGQVGWEEPRAFPRTGQRHLGPLGCPEKGADSQP